MPTKLIRSLAQVTPADRGGVVTMGNFDGVHLGHQALIERVMMEAKALGVPAILLTFEPHPAEFFGRMASTARLTSWREKYHALSKTGIDRVVIIKFNQLVANTSASDFLDKIIYPILQPHALIVGDDFRFGKNRQGDLALLSKVGMAMGFTVDALPSFVIGNERVSSTRIRGLLAQGQFAVARQLLGHPYCMEGRVVAGDKLGRELGFPTANINLNRKQTPLKGIFSVLVHGLGDKPIPGAASIGTRPSVDGTKMLLEVHLLDFHQDIYGCHVRVEFCEKLRDEEYYPSLALLKEQITKDVAATRDYFIKSGCL